MSPLRSNRQKNSILLEFNESELSKPPSIDQEGIGKVLPKVSLRVSMREPTKSPIHSTTVSPKVSKIPI